MKDGTSYRVFFKARHFIMITSLTVLLLSVSLIFSTTALQADEVADEEFVGLSFQQTSNRGNSRFYENDIYGGLKYLYFDSDVNILSEGSNNDFEYEDDLYYDSSPGFFVGARNRVSPQLTLSAEYSRFTFSDDVDFELDNNDDGNKEIDMTFNTIGADAEIDLVGDEATRFKFLAGVSYHFGDLEVDISSDEDDLDGVDSEVDLNSDFGYNLGFALEQELSEKMTFHSNVRYRFLDLDIDEVEEEIDGEDRSMFNEHEYDMDAIEFSAGISYKF
ncbi:outer membrane beta-barrel protein [Halarsenatibacter silvermanii]|uniref:Outer membrane protein beta-barrel domain-containing protein n=1 Tax=Halarsenatibacter silvermanii TaxID=321763 RepID=A0A1G9LD82_9FIRM|nr:outer membrane beta-barrel protein [Halarsenatibacter silvermanii]SDL59824.1 Outer membrane protein beta-barrel domain-containing protein [Halarsenatibacter silvermanii]